MSDTLNPDDLGGVNETGGVANSGTPSSFASPIEQKLFAALPSKQARLEQVDVQVPFRTEQGSQRAQDRVNQNAGTSREQQFAQSVAEELPAAQETSRTVRREQGGDYLGSLQTGAVRLGNQVYNIPSTTDLFGRLNSLSETERIAINEVTTYEAKRETLQKSLSDIVERTDLNPLAREFMRGTVQKELDSLKRPDDAYLTYDSARALNPVGLGEQALAAGGKTTVASGTTLREFHEGIQTEYADIQENDAKFEEFKAKTDPIFKEDFQRANEENTKDGLKQASEGVKALEEGRYASGLIDVIGGSLRTLGGSVESALDNPQGVFEIVSETAPQMASAFIPYVNLLTNTAYVGDVYKEALNEYKEENNGALPDQETLATMQTAALGAGLLEVAADKFLVGGTGKLVDGIDPAIRAAVKGATSNSLVRNAVTRVGARGASTAVVEGATEAGQTALEEVAKGNEVEGAEVSASAVIGAAAGGAFAGGAQAAKETAKGVEKGTEKVQEVASKTSEAIKKSGPTEEETLIRKAGKRAAKPTEKQTSQDKEQIREAKDVLKKQEAILSLLENGGAPETAIEAQRKKVERLRGRSGQLDSVKPNAAALTETTEDQSAEDFLGEVAYQIALDENGDLDADQLQKAVDIAVQKGATDEQVADIQAIIKAKKSSAEVSNDIIIGSEEWRGGGTYITNIINAINTRNDAAAVHNLEELQRFSNYMDDKLADYKTAQAEARSLGRSVSIKDSRKSAELGETIPYETLEGKPVYASGTRDTDSLIESISKDTDILGGILSDAYGLFEGGFEGTAEDILAQYIPRQEENTDETAPTEETESVESTELDTGDTGTDTGSNSVETETEATQTETQPETEESVQDPTIKANTEKVSQDLDEVVERQSIANRDSTVEALDLPKSEEVIARAANSTKSAGVKAAVRELGKQIKLKEEYGVSTTPLDSSITEAHYTAGLEAIQKAYDDPKFGQLKGKTVGDTIKDSMPDSYTGTAETAEDKFLLTNEFVTDTTVDSTVANKGVTPKVVIERASELNIPTAKTSSIIRGLRVSYQPIMGAVVKRFDTVMVKKFKDGKFAKFDTNWLSNFRDNTGHMSAFIRDGGVLSAIEYLVNNAKNSEAPTTSMVRAFGRLDSKDDVPEKLAALANSIGIGDTQEALIESLGSTAFKIAGVKFKDIRGNTKARHTSALGKLMLDALLDVGVIQGKKVSVNRLAWAGANFDTTGLAEKLNATEVETYPRRHVGKYIDYNGTIYEWSGSNYKVYDDVTQGHYVQTYVVNPDSKFGDIEFSRFLSEMKGTSTSYSKIFGTDHMSRIPAMGTPRKNTGAIKGFDHKKLNPTQRKAQDKQSSQKLFLDKGIMDIKLAFGDDRIMRVAGYSEFDEESTNKVLALSKKGKNQTVLSDMNGLNQFILDMESEAEILGEADYRDIPFFANFFNSSYQRQFVDSQTFNYQSSKSMHRFMAHHGSETFTLSDDTQRVAFLVSVAQGMGISADKLSSAQSIKDLHALIEEHPEPVAAMQRYERGDQISEDDMDTIVDFAASEENMHTLLALREFARYVNAIEDEQDTMEVVMPIELDGVNNGPITAILQSMQSHQDYEATMRKSGITYADVDTRTNGQRYEQRPEGLYEEGAAAVQKELTDIVAGLESAENMNRLSILRSQTSLKALKPKQVSLKQGLEIKRNETKGLITKLFYNAGDKSLLRAEVNDLTANFYEELQNVIDGKTGSNLKHLVAHIARASTSPDIPFSKEEMSTEMWTKAWSARYSQMLNDLDTPEKMLEYSLPPEVVTGLNNNMKHETSFGSAKLSAIKNTYNEAVSQAKLTTKMTTVGAVFARDIVAAEVQKRREELGLSKYETLSNKDMETIYKKLGDRMPNLSLDMHTQVDKSDAIPLYSYDRTPTDSASRPEYALNNGGTAPIYVAGREVTDIGAGGVAASTISVADASTIMGIMGQMNEGFMTVFDGVLINGLKMDVLAQAANVAYFKSLKNNNTFAQIADNFALVTQMGSNSLSDEFALELYRKVVPVKEQQENPSRNEMDAKNYAHIQYLLSASSQVAADLRKNEALGEKDLAVDQFGAVNDKTTIINPSSGNATDKFDELDVLSNNVGEYYENDGSNPNNVDSKIHKKQTNNSSLAGFINRNWGSARRLTKRGNQTVLRNLIKQAGIPESEYGDFLRLGLVDNVLLPAFNSIGELPAIHVVDEAGMHAATKSNRPAKGAFVYGENAIYLNSDRNGVNPETLFHELVHAALDVALVNKGRQSADFAQSLEQLGQEAAAYLQKNSSVVTRFNATGFTTDIDNNRIPWIKSDGSVNTREFLSWSLTNFHTVTELSQARAETNPDGLFGKIFNAIRKIMRSFFKTKSEPVEDSILSYIFATAADLAEGAEKPRPKKKGRSLQEDYNDIQYADHETTFDNLATGSRVSAAELQHLHEVFVGEILPAINEAPHTYAPHLNNSVDKMNDLAASNVDINPSQLGFIFGMSPIGMHVYEMYQKVMAAGLDDFSVSAKELSELYRTAKTNLKPVDFLLPGEVTTDSQAMSIAKDKYDAVFGSAKAFTSEQVEFNAAGIKTVYHRSNYLANFAALARTNQEFRTVLEKSYNRTADKRTGIVMNDLDVIIANKAVEVTGFLVDAKTGTRKLKTYKDRIDKLAGNVAATDQRAKSYLEQKFRRAIDAKDALYAKYSKAFDVVFSAIFDNRVTKEIRDITSEYAAGAKEWFGTDKSSASDEIFYQLHHGYLQFIPRFFDELSATNESNKRFRRLSISKAKSVAGARDGIIKATKAKLNKLFPNGLTENQETALTEILLDGDLHALIEYGNFTTQDLIRTLQDEAVLDNFIADYENQLYTGSSNYGNFHVRSAYSLGTQVATGQPSEGFSLSNAELIAKFRLDMAQDFDQTKATEQIEVLASLVALKHSKQASRNTVANMYKDKPSEMATLDRMLTVYKDDVLKHQYNNNGNRVLKSNSQEIYDDFRDIRFVTKDKVGEFTGSNYGLRRVIKKDRDDGNPEDVYMVFSSTGGLGTYQQGLYSTINSSLNGVQNLDGRTVTDGFDSYAKAAKYSKLTKARKMSAIEAMFKPGRPSLEPKELMVPVVNDAGVVTGFQYTLSRKEKEHLLGREKRFSEVLPASIGRTVEATHSDDYNKRVNIAIKQSYDAAVARGENLDKFIEISNKAPTKRGREAYRMMPPAARAHLKTIWGDKAFVDSSLFDTVYGYRKASLSDVFRKNSDSPNWAKQLGRLLTANYKFEGEVVSGTLIVEKGLGEVSSLIKDMIVVRGLQVMFGNMLSNTVQLTLQEDMGVGEAVKYQIEGLRHAKTYQQQSSKKRKLEFESRITENPEERRAIQARIAEIDEELAKNPARELIDAGMLTAIVEDIDSSSNPFSYTSEIGSYVSGVTANLPKGAKFLLDTATVSQDSGVYEALYMFTQLGDFSSRYAVAKHREKTTGKKLTQKDYDEIVDAFVNYDLPSNKYLQYLGDVGQMWFFKYFFRIQNVIIRNTIRNPRRVLDLMALSSITGMSISTYFDAFFLFNSITNKFGFQNYAEMGINSIPSVQVYDFVTS